MKGRSTVGAVELDIEGEGTQRFTLALNEVGTDTPERLLARIEQARASRAGGPRAQASIELGATTDIPAHLAKVRRLATETTEYRTGALAPEHAEALVADPHAPPASRAVAAVALIASSPVEGKQRVRIAAEGTADRNLRAALEAAAAEDEALLAEKLGALRTT